MSFYISDISYDRLYHAITVVVVSLQGKHGKNGGLPLIRHLPIGNLAALMPSVLEAFSTYSEILVEHAQSKKIFYLAHALSDMTFDSFRLRAVPVTGGVGIL